MALSPSSCSTARLFLLALLLGALLSGPISAIDPIVTPTEDAASESAVPPPTELGEAAVRVLVVGDSWADFMWINRSLRNTFAANGHPEILEEGSTTAISGSTAAEWAEPGRLALITDALAANSTVDVVQVTIGGNDFLAGQPGGGWFVGMDSNAFEALQNQILVDAATVIDHILSVRPGIDILLSQYDYTNFQDGTLPLCPGTWNDLGQPTPLQINTAATIIQDRVEAFAATRSEVSFVRHLGLMQFYFGFPADGIDPGDLIPPGALERPTPIEAMLLGLDCFHLGGAGYDLLAQHLWDEFYEAHFTGLIFGDGFESGDTAAWAQ